MLHELLTGLGIAEKFWKLFGRPSITVAPFDPNRDLVTWTFTDRDNELRRFLTCEVTNTGRTTARDLHATIQLAEGGTELLRAESAYSLHWAGLPYSYVTAGARPVDLRPGETRRLDLAFAMGVGLPGAWLATDLALKHPALHQHYLPPGKYVGRLRFGWADGKAIGPRVTIVSTANWQEMGGTFQAK